MHRPSHIVALLTPLLLSFTAVAQKPVLVRNADEPGRNPFQQSVLFNQTADSCPNDFYCVANFTPVPAGYRLVITYASARFLQNTSYESADANLAIDSALFGTEMMLPGSVDSTTQRSYHGGGAITFYVDAGHTPSLIVSGYNIRSGNTAQAAIAGYLVPLT